MSRRLLVFAKPGRPGRVKTRLIGELTAEQAAELHEALLLDLLDRLAGGDFSLRLAWALEEGDEPPPWSPPWVRQEGPDLGARLHRALAAAAGEGHAAVAAVGSDHPDLDRADVEAAFARVEAGAGVALAPAGDGGYSLIALAAAAVRPELFAGVPWSTSRVLEETLARCRRLGLEVALLPERRDLDTPDDLHRLAADLAAGPAGRRRAHSLFEAWGLLPGRLQSAAMRILTAEAMAAVDRRAIEEVGIPGPVLMENAAIGLADAVGELFPEAEAVAIFCGPGNNGGDGLALARHLDGRGYEVAVFLAAFGKTLSEDCAAQLAILRHHEAVEIVELGEDDDLVPALAAAREHDLVVDALFGTGLARPLEGRFAELVEGIDELPPPVLAVDLPSGLAGSRSEIPGPHVEADVTVTFGAPKIAHVFPPAAEAAGELVVADLGLPPHLLEEAEGDLHLLRAEDLAELLGEREPASHKGDYGHALVLAGSAGKAGAAALAARAAVRAGAGLVTAAVPEPVAAIVAGASLESMTVALPAGEGGEIAEAAVEAVLAACEGKDALAAGPGLGRREETAAALREITRRCPLPAVLDADAVVAFAGRAAELRERPEGAGTVLTPHPGELGILLGIATAEVQADRPAAARRAAAETGAVVVLKGHLTLIAEPGGPVWVNPTGNPGMATGGTGDVLTGIAAALLARLGDPAAAARLAVWLHGAAGDAAAAARGAESLAAGDLLDHLPAAFAALRAG